MPTPDRDSRTPSTAPGLTLRTVLLRHELPGGTSHWDWMIQRRADSDSPLLTFRVDTPTNPFSLAAFEAGVLPDHRSLYLDYEGPLSNSRGTVTRVAHGVASLSEPSQDVVRITANFGGSATSWVGRHKFSDHWTFTRG